VANAAFDFVNIEPLTALQAWAGTLAYTLQIYFDFSGYSDMAVGLSLLIGVRLPYNFDSPYKSRSIIEFWRRWHMTLSRFLRDYLYIALGGNRHGSARRYLNLFLTMLLGGLWHGAGWTFVIWGGLHGCYLAFNHGWRWCASNIAGLRRLAGTAVARRAGTLLAWPLTLLAVVVSWVYFRAESLPAAHRMLACMADACTIAGPPPVIDAQWPILIASAAIALFAPNSQQLIDGSFRRALDRMRGRTLLGKLEPASLFVGAASVAVVMLAMISASQLITEFIYFNF
jgi:D-alanyl-lipoteichoic acid acyltransferase DltB (MBOAT superfamily)